MPREIITNPSEISFTVDTQLAKFWRLSSFINTQTEFSGSRLTSLAGSPREDIKVILVQSTDSEFTRKVFTFISPCGLRLRVTNLSDNQGLMYSNVRIDN